MTEEAVEIAITNCSSLETLNLQHCTKVVLSSLNFVFECNVQMSN